MYCSNCGVKNEPNAKFCKQCGKQLQQPQNQAVPKNQRVKVAPAEIKGKTGKKGLWISAIILLTVIASAAVFFFFRNTDYSRLYYKHLSEMKYGNNYDWMNAELVDLDNDDIPELIAAYGNQYQLNNIYGEDKFGQKTGSLSIFKYVDKEIVEYKEPIVLDFETKKAAAESFFTFNTDYSNEGISGSRFKNIFIKTIDEKDYLFVESVEESEDYLSTITGYGLAADGKVTPKIHLKYFEDWSDDSNLLKAEYKYNGRSISENQYNQYVDKYQHDSKEFLINEEGQEGDFENGESSDYQINGSNYKFAMNLKTNEGKVVISEKETESAQEDYRRARQLFNDGKYDDALEACNDALSIDLNLEKVLLLKAEILLEDQLYVEANQIITRLLTIDPDNQEAIQLKTKEKSYTFNQNKLKSFVNDALKTGKFGPFNVNMVGLSFDKIEDIFGEPTDVYESGCTNCDDFDAIYFDHYYFEGFGGNSTGLYVYMEDLSVNELISLLGEPDEVEDGMWLSYEYNSPNYTISAIIDYDGYSGTEMVSRLAISGN